MSVAPRETEESSTNMLKGYAPQMCAEVEGEEEQLLCAARKVNAELIRGYGPPPGGGEMREGTPKVKLVVRV